MDTGIATYSAAWMFILMIDECLVQPCCHVHCAFCFLRVPIDRSVSWHLACVF